MDIKKIVKLMLNEQTNNSNKIETESGSAEITKTGVSFDNSGYKQQFSHDEIAKLRSGKRIRGFKKDSESSDSESHVYTDDEEEHHLPLDWYDKNHAQ